MVGRQPSGYQYHRPQTLVDRGEDRSHAVPIIVMSTSGVLAVYTPRSSTAKTDRELWGDVYALGVLLYELLAGRRQALFLPRAWHHGAIAIDMLRTWNYPIGMSKMVQIRNVPDELHRTLKARAALAGMSLSDYLLAEIRRSAERPTLSEMRERLEKRDSARLSSPPAAAVRAERDSR